jgi:hypothetical protein
MLFQIAITLFLIAAPVTFVAAQFMHPFKDTAADVIGAVGMLTMIAALALAIVGVLVAIWS